MNDGLVRARRREVGQLDGGLCGLSGYYLDTAPQRPPAIPNEGWLEPLRHSLS